MGADSSSAEQLSYPIGRWVRPGQLGTEELAEAVARIAALPGQLRAAVSGLDAGRFGEPYRPGGWTVRQLVHHVADSHLNAYLRVKLAATEDEPRICAYDQEAWARLPDVAAVPVDASLAVLDGLHARWVALLESFGPAEWSRRYDHPENGLQRLDEVIHHYAWHGEHHLAHVTRLRARMGW